MKALIIIGLLLSLVSAANADCFYCGSSVVCSGETKMDVIVKCGQPDDSEVTSNLDGQSFTTLYYNCGEGRFIRILKFVGSRLIRIKSGGYGSGPERCN